MKNLTPRNPGEQRRLAEERLKAREQTPRSALPVPRSDDPMLHELRVHQIELEMQNEELRTAQAEIEAGRERYFDLYDLAPVGYCTLSEQGLILEANLTAATLLGTPRSALVKQPISRFILKNDQDIYYLHRKQLFDAHSNLWRGSGQAGSTGSPQAGEPQECDLRLVKSDGSSFWAHLTLTASQAEDGTPVCRVVLIDITKRKQAEKGLIQTSKLLEDAQALANLGSWEWDIGHDTWHFSEQWKKIHGVSEKSLETSKLTEIAHPEDAPYIEKAFSDAKDGGKTYDIEHRIIRADDKQIRHIKALGKVEFDLDTGRPVRMVGTAQDITERKQAEPYREMGLEILQILNGPGDLQESIQRVLDALKTRTGVDAVGMRLQDGEDFPYFAQDGFSKDFLLTENTLLERGKDGGVCRDKDGKVSLECTCGLVISGKTDPSNPLCTQGGSCWTNDSFPLLDLPSDQDPRLHPRNNCIHQGYASVALIPVRIQDQMYSREACIRQGFSSMAQVPVRTSDRIVGLIQINDKRKGRFTLETIEILEGIATHIGSALMRKRAEEKLAASEGILRDIMESTLSGFWDWNLVDNTEYLSPTFKRMFGYEDHEMENSPEAWQKIIFPEDLPNVLKVFNRHVKSHGREPFYNEIRYRHRGGSTVWVICAGRVIEWANDGTAIRMVGCHFDITPRKQAEAAQEKLQLQLNQAQKMEAIGRLAGGVAHDFNNQLMGIMGYADFCRDGIAADHPIREWLDEITHGAERSAKLTRQLLAFARKQTIAPKVLDLNDAVAGILKMLRQLIDEDIDLLWQPGAELWPVKLDPGQVDQILANLCVNARDAISGVGKVTIETQNVTIDADYCEEHAEATPGFYVTLVVSDDGCGMDKETLAQIFDPFYTTKGVGEGTGLGLSTVYGIVKQNAGFINAYSEPGKGTTFRIYLTRFVGEDVKQAESRQASRPVGGSETILLVEDEKSVLVTTARFLEQLGYNVLAVDCPDEAQRKAAEHEGAIELLITDVIMPGMSGRDLAAKLTEEYPRMKSLFISGYTANVIAHRGILDEGVHFLAKPFTRDDIARKVYEMLKGKQTTSKE